MDQASQVLSQATAPSANVETVDVDAVNKKEERSLYKARVKIYPKRAKGVFRKLKWLVMAITLVAGPTKRMIASYQIPKPMML